MLDFIPDSPAGFENEQIQLSPGMCGPEIAVSRPGPMRPDDGFNGKTLPGRTELGMKHQSRLILNPYQGMKNA
jgi:hypothetical protein